MISGGRAAVRCPPGSAVTGNRKGKDARVLYAYAVIRTPLDTPTLNCLRITYAGSKSRVAV